MKKEQQLKDLPVRYQRKGRHWEDTITGTKIMNWDIHKYTKSFAETQDQLIRDKRYDLK